MKLTKYEHACVFLENDDGDKVVIDPGIFTNLPGDLSRIVAIVITHEHPDHFFSEKLDKILAQNPNAQIFGSTEVVTKLNQATEPEKLKIYNIGSFSLEFYGDEHELIRESLPIIKNLGVCINNLVAYPGDSYAQFPRPVRYLLTPSSGPWLRVREACEFIASTKSDVIVPTHDALLSDTGIDVYDFHFADTAKQTSKTYQRLIPSESIILSTT